MSVLLVRSCIYLWNFVFTRIRLYHYLHNWNFFSLNFFRKSLLTILCYKTLKAQHITKITHCYFTWNSSLLLVLTSQKVLVLLLWELIKIVEWIWKSICCDKTQAFTSIEHRPSLGEGDTEIFILILSFCLCLSLSIRHNGKDCSLRWKNLSGYRFDAVQCNTNSQEQMRKKLSLNSICTFCRIGLDNF